MYYEINVSFKGRHLFATHKRSIQNPSTLKKVADIFKEKFPESEGYQVTADHHPEVSEGVDLNNIEL